MLSLLTGLAAGSLHVVSGPDHLAALAPVAVQGRRAAARLGAIWGLGHGLAVVALGGLGVLLRGRFDLAWVSTWSELAVGIVLVLIGLWTVRQALRLRVHAHPHGHGHEGAGHSHLHVHVRGVPHTDPRAHRRHTHMAFGVGMLHGAAGAGHLFGIVPALALPPAQATVYLGGYLLAAIGSMSVFGAMVGFVARSGRPNALRWVTGSSGALALVVGVGWMFTAWPSA